MRQWLWIVLLTSLFGCVGTPPRSPAAALLDLGVFQESGHAVAVPIENIEVRPASWLASSSILYRLEYDDALRRHAYAQTRWAAPPAELIERMLQRHISSDGATARGCRLRVILDEFEQRFDKANSSRTVMEGRMELHDSRHGLLARHAFAIARPAPTPDARGGVLAARDAVGIMAGELSQWLAHVARDQTGPACLPKVGAGRTAETGVSRALPLAGESRR